jgi:hypothetical protein
MRQSFEMEDEYGPELEPGSQTGHGLFDNQPTSFYDFYRVVDGKMVEHWDVIETLLPSAQWKNANGKF